MNIRIDLILWFCLNNLVLNSIYCWIKSISFIIPSPGVNGCTRVQVNSNSSNLLWLKLLTRMKKSQKIFLSIYRSHKKFASDGYELSTHNLINNNTNYLMVWMKIVTLSIFLLFITFFARACSITWYWRYEYKLFLGTTQEWSFLLEA